LIRHKEGYPELFIVKIQPARGNPGKRTEHINLEKQSATNEQGFICNFN
jgi:hypothetical protein